MTRKVLLKRAALAALLAATSIYVFADSSAGGGPSLRGEKNVGLASDVDGDGQVSPGDVLSYSIRVQNGGDATATEVVLTDPIPFATTLVPSSIFISQGTLVDVDPLIVDIGEITGSQTSVSIGFRVEIDDPVPAGTRAIANQGIVSSLELPDVVTDDPSTPENPDATVAVMPEFVNLTDVPSLGGIGFWVLVVGLLASAIFSLRRQI